jgi:hypothetical protein
MAELKAFPKGSTEAIVWTLHPDANPEEIAASLASSGNNTITTVGVGHRLVAHRSSRLRRH